MTKTYEAIIRLEECGIQKVSVDADSPLDAKRKIEALHGADCILTGPLLR